jgi:pimeloyl-ACP methyl ester carboxylesterase
VRRTPRPVVAAALLALTLPLAGCISWFLPPEVSSTSTPTMEDVAADLEPFYHQVLHWESCGDAMQCTTATAPMDWSDPARDSIELALIRQPATSADRIGSLLVNPGGPGGSGYDFILDSIDYATDARLQAGFDIVGFDPRGVNRSTAVSCYQDPRELDEYLYGISPNQPGSDAWIADLEAANEKLGQACLEHTGALLHFVDTVSAARDLDLLRAMLGDQKLNYLGYSYGTLLGATYADLYPGNTGRMVFDGAVDPATSNFDVTATQAQGFESAMRAYLAECLPSSDCPFDGTVDDAMNDIRALLDSLDASPLTNTDGRQLGSAAMFTAIILPLYNQGNWPYLTQLFADVKQGDPSFAFSLADSYNGRNPDGTYADNQTEAFIAINCLDYDSDDDLATMRAEAAELKRLAPVFGPQMAWGGTGCANWPFPSERERMAITAPGSADILVLGTTNDPATPYVWAKNMADQLENGHLVTYQGEGHTAYNKSNSCVNDVVDEFLLNGTVPVSDPMC